MSLTPGTRLGVYEITAQIGEGGMGTVYRATDTSLSRQVAIKVLPDAFAADPDRLVRFEREAKTLASLNHPHIAAIYAIEKSAGATALVMELVEGEDLSQRIARGAIPVDEALPIAKQIAEALEAAHEQGIIHRDLKPANIKVRADGTVKVLDFGLAKAMDPPAGSSPNVSQLPTITTPAMTQAGMILGTAAYMAPEQAKGRPVDKRADIWAFGAVLFEMLTGTRAFRGDDVQDTFVAIMRDDPDWTRLPGTLPPTLGAYLRRCLHKDPRQRIGDIRDVRLALEGAFDIAVPGATAASTLSPRPLWTRAVPVVAAAVIAGVAGWIVGRPVAPSAPAQRVSIMLPDDQSLTQGCSPCSPLAISPDGTQLAYVSTAADFVLGGATYGPLYVRSLGSRSVRELPGTTGARQPFFSPDGQWVAFFTRTGDLKGELKKIALAGGNPVTVLTSESITGFEFGTWTDGQGIVFDSLAGLQRVSAEGGPPAALTTTDRSPRDGDRWPEAVTGTETLLFTEFAGSRPPGVEAVNLDGSGRRVVLENASNARYASSGHLLFQRDDALLVAPFDAATLALTGPAVPLVDDAYRSGPLAQVVVSRTGTLAYVPGIDPKRMLGVVSRTGSFEPLGLQPDRFDTVSVAPTGEAVAFDVLTGAARETSEVRTYDLARGSTTKVPAAGWSDAQPAWHPNGRALAVYSQKPDGTRGLFLREPGGAERLLLSDPGPILGGGLSWTPDGATLAYVVRDVGQGARGNIWVAATGTAPEAHRLFDGPTHEQNPAFSPDGRWLAYVTNDSGRLDVYVRRYPQGDRVAVSTSGGGGPVWRGDGKEIFFQTVTDSVPKIMAASVSAQGDRLVVGQPAPLFDMRMTSASGVRERYLSSSIVGRRWDVFPDGQRFLMIRTTDNQSTREIVLVQHWDEELKRLVPTK